jgi:type IV secretory pathway VirB10-like protein
MGTSSPYGGHKDHNPLLPRDYINGDGPFPPPQDDAPPPVSDKPDNPKDPPEEQKTSNDKDNKNDPPQEDKAKKTENNKKPLKRETSWREAKSSFSRHINGSSHKNIQKTMRAYGQAYGSTKGLIVSSKAGIAAGNALAQFITNNINRSDDLSNRIRNIFNSGHELKTVLSQLANALSPSPDDKESSIAREAITSTMCHLYEYYR